MLLLISSTENVFNEELIVRGGFLRCKAKGWSEYKNCLVSKVGKGELIAMAQEAPHGVIYIKIPAADVDAGLWDIFYSNDLEAYTHVENNQEETP